MRESNTTMATAKQPQITNTPFTTPPDSASRNVCSPVIFIHKRHMSHVQISWRASTRYTLVKKPRWIARLATSGSILFGTKEISLKDSEISRLSAEESTLSVQLWSRFTVRGTVLNAGSSPLSVAADAALLSSPSSSSPPMGR